ncbi:MAG: M28 family peptidase, partial [candidate division Zixibacteria bacterium]|nr:M28 family peptidase [candidate division Zixibacteria bacterium]
MRTWSVLAFFILVLTAGGAVGADLYKVLIQSSQDADLLRETRVDPIVRVSDGYLVLADGEVSGLTGSGLSAELIASKVTRRELAIDGRLDRANVGKAVLLYEDGNLRLFRVSDAQAQTVDLDAQMFPLGRMQPRIEYKEPRNLQKLLAPTAIGLDSLISLVSQDSLESYTSRLQAFYRRLAGTDSSRAARDWIAAKFLEHGVDSVAIDTFTATLSGTPTECYNVVGYKFGTRFPDHQIVVGGHYDAVSSSPGADDNGSGTAGTLEIARVLADVETDMTFIFIAFDAEEFGLYGAYHYANEALAAGDSIVYMLNMDMIAHYENTTQVKLYHGTETAYSELFQSLASSLVGITGILSGSSGGSDHYPFAQNGYDVTFVHEYIFSTVYHSYQDSTTYMDFEYMTKLVQASAATVYQV